jgi:hypothetical protein
MKWSSGQKRYAAMNATMRLIVALGITVHGAGCPAIGPPPPSAERKMAVKEIPGIVETLTSYLAIQSSHTEAAERRMMEFKAEVDRLRTSDKELRGLIKWYVDWTSSRVPPNPWEAIRIDAKARAVLTGKEE